MVGILINSVGGGGGGGMGMGSVLAACCCPVLPACLPACRLPACLDPFTPVCFWLVCFHAWLVRCLLGLLVCSRKEDCVVVVVV